MPLIAFAPVCPEQVEPSRLTKLLQPIFPASPVTQKINNKLAATTVIASRLNAKGLTTIGIIRTGPRIKFQYLQYCSTTLPQQISGRPLSSRINRNDQFRCGSAKPTITKPLSNGEIPRRCAALSAPRMSNSPPKVSNAILSNNKSKFQHDGTSLNGKSPCIYTLNTHD